MFKRYGKKLISIVMAFLIIPMSIVSANGYSSKKGKRDVFFERLQALLNSNRDATWTAKRNEISDMPDADFQNSCGVLPYVDRDSLIEETVISRDNGENRLPTSCEVEETPVKEQGSCGSCYAFAANACYESWYKKNKGSAPDLSEQYFLLKAKELSEISGGCNGSTLQLAADILQKYGGVPSESQVPYKGFDGDTTPLDKEYSKKYTVDQWGRTTDFSTMKTKLSEGCALLVSLIVYSDLKYYGGGVYRYTSGENLGHHAVCIVGFDDAKQAFKVKNSWGSGWGENGYFWIGYDQMENAVALAGKGGCYYIKG